MMTSADAKALARIQHAGQVDEAGEPFIEHLDRVAAAAEIRARHARQAGLSTDVDAIVQAAWLHDVVEDTPTTAEDLRAAGFAEPVIEMVQLLTPSDDGRTCAERVAALIASGNLGAILIKLSDDEDNADPYRAQPEEAERLERRYAASMVRLRKAAAALGYTGP
nr:HD domain-containing protein [Methylobacterium sp. WSM2598]